MTCTCFLSCGGVGWAVGGGAERSSKYLSLQLRQNDLSKSSWRPRRVAVSGLLPVGEKVEFSGISDTVVVGINVSVS